MLFSAWSCAQCVQGRAADLVRKTREVEEDTTHPEIHLDHSSVEGGPGRPSAAILVGQEVEVDVVSCGAKKLEAEPCSVEGLHASLNKAFFVLAQTSA